VKVELVGGPSDGKTMEAPEEWQHTINVATPTFSFLDFLHWTSGTDHDALPAYVTTVYRFDGINDDGTRRFTCLT
jgi:hypothetical protein